MVPVSQAQSLELKPQYHQNKKGNKEIQDAKFKTIK
jgi:hypothetical protein